MASKQAVALLTRTELAAALGVHPVTVTKWGAAGMPVADRGARGLESRYSLPAVVAWRIASEVQRLTGGDGAVLNLAAERAKLARAQTRRSELDTRRREGQVLEAREVELKWSALVIATRNHLLGLPTRAKGRLPHLTVTDLAVLDALVRESLEALAGPRDEDPKKMKTCLRGS